LFLESLLVCGLRGLSEKASRALGCEKIAIARTRSPGRRGDRFPETRSAALVFFKTGTIENA
jgi:hypothetical protein